MANAGDQFETLETVISLVEGGRLNAAVSVWKSLETAFQKSLLTYTLFCIESGELPKVDCVAATPYGQFEINARNISRLMATIPKVARAHAAGTV